MTPPRLARALLRLTLAARERDDVLQNLDELYRHRCGTHGARSTWIWYWMQAFTFAARVRAHERVDRQWDTQSSSHKRTPSNERVTEFLSDVRFALRFLRRAPGFTTAAVSTLALGIGANALIFAVVEEALFRPLPYPEADRLVWLWPDDDITLTHRQFDDLQSQPPVNAELTAFAGRSFAITGGEVPEEVDGVAVSTNHFSVFGLPPVLGRSFQRGDAEVGAEPVAILGYDLWRSHFAADSVIIGRRVNLYTAAAIPMVPGAFTGTPHTVIGVAPPDYQPFGAHTQVFVPLVGDVADPAYSNMGELRVVGRLRPGGTPVALRDELARLAAGVSSLDRVSDDMAVADAIGLREAYFGNVRSAMIVTLGAVGLVLLIACANVANLSLVRSHGRRSEFALRHALGADRSRLVRQLLTESLVVSTIAVALGCSIAYVATPLAQRVLPAELGTTAIRMDGYFLVFCIAILAVTALFCGIVQPSALQSTSGSRDCGGGRRRHIISQGLVIGEIALALALTYGAGLMLTSLARLSQADVGFDGTKVMTVRVAPSEQQYQDATVRRALFDRILERARQLPGVVEAGAIHFLPIADGGPAVYFLANPAEPEEVSSAGYRVITPGYLETMRIPVLSGRPIVSSDQSGSEPVGLVNEALAAQLWPGRDPIGQTMFRTGARKWFTVIGVVGNVRQAALGLPPREEIYLPAAQSAWASAMTIVVRVDRSTPSLGESLRSIVRDEDRNVPVTRVAWMEDLIGMSVASPRFYSALFSLFALLALVLGGVGVYGVASYVANQRSRQIGIQVALGATAGRIMRGELRRGGLVAAAGIAIGGAAAFVASRFVQGMLYEVSPFDPMILASAAVILGVIAFIGIIVPARRASRVDPMSMLRV